MFTDDQKSYITYAHEIGHKLGCIHTFYDDLSYIYMREYINDYKTKSINLCNNAEFNIVDFIDSHKEIKELKLELQRNKADGKNKIFNDYYKSNRSRIDKELDDVYKEKQDRINDATDHAATKAKKQTELNEEVQTLKTYIINYESTIAMSQLLEYVYIPALYRPKGTKCIMDK